MGVQPFGRLRRGETLCNIKGTTAQFVGSAGDAFSAICFLQKSRFTSSKPSILSIASDEKFIHHLTTSFHQSFPDYLEGNAMKKSIVRVLALVLMLTLVITSSAAALKLQKNDKSDNVRRLQQA